MVVIHIIEDRIYMSVDGAPMKQCEWSELFHALQPVFPGRFITVPPDQVKTMLVHDEPEGMQ